MARFLLLLVLSFPAFGVEMEKFDRSNEPITLTVIVYKNQGDLDKAYKKITGDNPPKHLRRRGFASWNLSKPYKCTIHILDKKGQVTSGQNQAVIGEELRHCIYGNFHPEEGH